MWESIRAWGIVPGIWSGTVRIFFEEPMTHGRLVVTRVEASVIPRVNGGGRRESGRG